MSTPLLTVDKLRVAYGASQVLFDVDAHVQPGEVSGLLGRNGMGKTTLIRSIIGLKDIPSGGVAFEGQPVSGKRPDAIARLGVAVVPEGRQVFPNLSVDEHLSAFANVQHARGTPWTPASVYELFPRLAERNPKLLIFDEATEGLAPLIREEIWHCIERLRAAGQTLIVVDKYVSRLVRIADRHIILEKGRVAWQGSSEALAGDKGLWHRYLGV
jgi:branched-chain amino acid transport system ATP-binding protein